MLHILYLNKERGVAYPLCVQAPKIFLPAGMKDYHQKDGKINTNALCSLGREWESNPSMVAFRSVCVKIQKACVRLVMNKNLNVPYYQNEEQVYNAFTPIVDAPEKPSKDDPTKLIKYPPCFKMIINTNTNKRTLLVCQTSANPHTGEPIYAEISHLEVVAGASAIPMLHFRWIYRRMRSNPNGWTFSINVAAHQAIVQRPSVMNNANTCSLSVVI